jgi:trimeric autotransporter adhesin
MRLPLLSFLSAGRLIIILLSLSFFSKANAQADNCSGVIPVTVNTNTTCTIITTGTTASATSSGIAGCAAVTPDDDVWYSFVAVANSHTITVTPTGLPSLNNPAFDVFTDCSGAGSRVTGSCTNVSGAANVAETATLTGLAIGSTYYVRIFSVANNAAHKGQFTLCISTPVPANDNCTGAIGVPVNASNTCTSTTMGSSFSATQSQAGCTGTADDDVWFSFTATATAHAIRVTPTGASPMDDAVIQAFSGACGSLTSLGCANFTSGSSTELLSLTGLSAGTVYRFRVHSVGNGSGQGTFNVCVNSAPSNDNCTGAIDIPPQGQNWCSYTAVSSFNTTAAPSPAACTGVADDDVWFSFTATASLHTIRVVPAGGFPMNDIVLQVFSGTCASPTSIACVNTTTGSSSEAVTLTGLTVGTTYRFRVYSAASGTGQGDFNICINSAPSNDNCSSPIALSYSADCSSQQYAEMINTTASGITPTCYGAPAANNDVWFTYTITAANTNPVFNITWMGDSLAKIGIRTQLFTGSACGSLTSRACGINFVSTAGMGLTAGTICYVRVYTASPMSSYNEEGWRWGFNICVGQAQTTRTDVGRSYINVTKGTTGGTVDVGDILEIRNTLVVFNQSIDSAAFYDTLRNTRGFRYVPGTLTLRTNEGKIYGSAYTEAADADPGHVIQIAGLDTAIQIKMGLGATGTAKGMISNYSKPSFYGRCIVMATYRVQVYAPYNTKINYGGGAFTYRETASGTNRSAAFKRDSLLVYSSPGLCAGAAAASNAVLAESGGTFGVPSGPAPIAKERGTSPFVLTYGYKPFKMGINDGPDDYFYAISNNTSTQSFTTLNTWTKPYSNYRLFTVWDITGDHTGATDPLAGNPPCDTTLPVSATNPCGYMLVVNSAYKTDTAFQYSITGLCPNTYYEVSAWFKNICYLCGSDSNSVGGASRGAGYIPSAPGDSSGVQPNIGFEINGTDYYTTGNIPYVGLGAPHTSDANNKWTKKGFVYQTGASETSLLLTLRNNAPGGGGNDWALDDIAVKTCLPNLTMRPSVSPTYCRNASINVSVAVSTFYNNYQYYIWERSTNGGASWHAAPEMVPGGIQTFSYTYVAPNYLDTVAIPTFIANSSMNGYMYRIRAATTTSNLGVNSCSIYNNSDVITIAVSPSCNVLPTEILSFNAQLKNGYTELRWSSKQEQTLQQYDVERSIDGRNFITIGTVSARGGVGEEAYTFTDADAVTGKLYYRIRLVAQANSAYKFSNILSVTAMAANSFELTNLVNPFNNKISFQLQVPQNQLIDVQLLDASGKPVYQKKINVSKGVNSVQFQIPSHLQNGNYLLRVMLQQGVVHKLIQKQ